MTLQEEQLRLSSLSISELNNEIARWLGWTEISFTRFGWKGKSPKTHKQESIPSYAFDNALAFDLFNVVRDRLQVYLMVASSPEALTYFCQMDHEVPKWSVWGEGGTFPYAMCYTTLIADYKLKEIQIEGEKGNDVSAG